MVCTDVRSNKTFRRANSFEFSIFLIRTCHSGTVYKNNYLGFEVLTAVDVNSSMFRDMTPSSPLEADRHFGGTCRFHLQGRRISSACYLIQAGFLLGLVFDPEVGDDMFLRNVG
jgi:hypothetical protein